MEYGGPSCSWAGSTRWVGTLSRWKLMVGWGTQGRVSAAPLTSIQDVAHDVPSNPQLLHVARS